MSADADLERRFGGLRRLYGDAAYTRLRALRLAVVGLGGVGSWAAEALARSGVAALTLIDLDHVAESNINRQVQALGATVGMAKGQALAARIGDIHPHCHVTVVDDFVTPENWPALLPAPVNGLIDACDHAGAKLTLATWARSQPVAFVLCGAAGGKRQAHQLRVDDLAAATHDPLLAALRQRLRKAGAPREGAMALRCVYGREPVQRPAQTDDCRVDGSLNCQGYGSTVTVTAAAGLMAAGDLIEQCLSMRRLTI